MKLKPVSKRTPTADLDERTLDALTAVYLLAQSHTQEQIATRLGISQAKVSRLIQEAEGDFLRRTVRFDRARLSDDVFAFIQQRAYRSELQVKLDLFAERASGRSGPDLRVFSSGSPAQGWNVRVAQFGAAAAGFVRELLVTTDVCGVTWGRHIEAAVNGIAGLPSIAKRRNDPLVFFPLCGEAPGDLPSHRSATTLASRLSREINGNNDAPSLGAVPCLIPADFTAAEERGVRKMIARVRDYELIFGTTAENSRSRVKPLIERASTILSGVGPGVRSRGGEMFRKGGLDLGRMAKLVHGDLGGYFLERDGLSSSQAAELRRLNLRWTGIKREHLLRCAEAADAREPSASIKRKHGVVLVAIGAVRCDVLVEIARQGLSNIWVIDHDLERALSEKIGWEIKQMGLSQELALRMDDRFRRRSR